jgi:hypothetical protein
MVACPMSQGSFVPPMRAALSARVSPHDQPILTMQRDALPEFATRCQWTVTDAVEEIAAGDTDQRPKYQALLKAAQQRQLEVCGLATRPWGHSLVEAMTTLHERTAFGIGWSRGRRPSLSRSLQGTPSPVSSRSLRRADGM